MVRHPTANSELAVPPRRVSTKFSAYFLGSSGRTRTCNPPVNSRMLYH